MIWTIIGAVVALLAFATTLTSMIVKRIRENTAVQTRVAVELEQIGKTLQESTKRNSEAHKEFYDKLEDHETRITVLEVKNQ